MSSPISICNQALAAVGTRSTIASLDEASNEALQCKLQYESARDTVLRGAHWGFARRFASAGLLKTATPATVWTSSQPPPPWTYQYAYPSDCLMLRYVMGQEQSSLTVPLFGTQSTYLNPASSIPAKWAKIVDVVDDTEVQTICTNAPSAIFCYTRRIIDIDQFDALAENALVFGLASQIAMALTGDKTLVKGLSEQANNSLIMARVSDANEGVTINDVLPDWLAVRGVPSMTATSYTAEYGPLFQVS